MNETWVLPPKSTQSGGRGDDRGIIIVHAESVQAPDTAVRLGGEVREGGEVFWLWLLRKTGWSGGKVAFM